jgi:hypothetical protein
MVLPLGRWSCYLSASLSLSLRVRESVCSPLAQDVTHWRSLACSARTPKRFSNGCTVGCQECDGTNNHYGHGMQRFLCALRGARSRSVLVIVCSFMVCCVVLVFLLVSVSVGGSVGVSVSVRVSKTTRPTATTTAATTTANNNNHQPPTTTNNNDDNNNNRYNGSTAAYFFLHNITLDNPFAPPPGTMVLNNATTAGLFIKPNCDAPTTTPTICDSRLRTANTQARCGGPEDFYYYR